MKNCPKCNTPINKTQRYMNVVKKVYKDIWHVKRRIFGHIREIEAKRDELTAHMLALSDHEKDMEGSKEYKILYDKLLCELKPILRSRMNMLSSVETGTLKVQIEIFSQLVENYSKFCNTLDDKSKNEVLEYLDVLFQVIKKRQRIISNQEIKDISLEIQRFYRLCQLHKLKNEPGYKANCHNPIISRCYEDAYKIGYTIYKFTKEQDNAMKYALEAFGKEIKSAYYISNVEKIEIMKALNFTKGHWFKCPNGHIYAIGECGGAMEIGQCNECGAEIGGRQHRLLPSNNLAPEMDGATLTEIV
ncbi:hypothetical protein L9F63_014513, partial [Diploptera punctata]